MESYVELSFMHNYLINCFALTLSLILSKRRMSWKRKHGVLLILTASASFLFVEHSLFYVTLIELCIAFIYFSHRMKTYLLYISVRLLFHGAYLFFFFGTFCHYQFFIFDELPVIISDCFLLIIYFSIILKYKITLSQDDFIIDFILENKHYKGYLDSGNLCTYYLLPVIFIKEDIYEQLDGERVTLFIQQVASVCEVGGIEKMITIDSKTSKVICCPLQHDYPYDALLNMKGLL